jgi:ubiquinone/menaquinone biosynthesis C-methylase UbiE
VKQSISFDRIADRYDETRGGEQRGQAIAAEIEPHLGAARRILEVGVGTGVVSKAFDALGRTVVGVDISAEMLTRAHSRLGSRVARADGHTLPVPSATVDAAYLVWVLHLVADPPSVIAECARVLRGGGALVAVAGRVHADYADMTAHNDALDTLRNDRPDTAEAVAEWATAAGLHTIAHRELNESHEATPAQFADVLERRVFSFLWDVDDQTWSDVVQPAIDGLRALPDPTRPRPVVQHRDLLAFEKPS